MDVLEPKQDFAFPETQVQVLQRQVYAMKDGVNNTTFSATYYGIALCVGTSKASILAETAERGDDGRVWIPSHVMEKLLTDLFTEPELLSTREM
jgi:hypothetical protein